MRANPFTLPLQLRRDAETILARGAPALAPERSPAELLHELQVLQIELEMQNEALSDAQMALEASRDHFVELYDCAPVGDLTLTDRGLIADCNATAAALLGVAPGNLRQTPFARYFTPEDADSWHRHFVRVLKQDVRLDCELSLQRESGAAIHVRLVSQRRVVSGQATTVRVILDEIHAHKLAELALQESEARYRTLTAELQVGVLIQSPNAEIVLCNPKALELLGLGESQLLGKTSLDPDWNVIHDDGSPFPGHAQPVPQAIASGRPVRDVVMGVFRPASQDRVWLLVNADPQFAEDGSLRQVICTFSDITRRRQAEARLGSATVPSRRSPRASSSPTPSNASSPRTRHFWPSPPTRRRKSSGEIAASCKAWTPIR